MFDQVLEELKNLGNENIVKIYKNHGCDLETFGVKIADIKKLAKQYKNNHELGYQLLMSDNQDAIYLSQFIADHKQITKADLEKVIDRTNSYMVVEVTISTYVTLNETILFECLNDWLKSSESKYQRAGFSTYAKALSYLDNKLFDKYELEKFLVYAKEHIHTLENRVRYCLNDFVIAIGCFYPELTEFAKLVSQEIGKVTVHMGKTSCKVANAYDYITKVDNMNRLGKKRKSIC